MIFHRIVKKKQQTINMVVINKEEALNIIRSLTTQMMENNNSNIGRSEFITENGEYFSIAVDGNFIL